MSERQAAGKLKSEDLDRMTEIFGGLGMGLWAMGEKKQAAQFFARSCEADPSASCREKLGKIYFEIEEWDGAIRELAAAIQEKKDANLYAVLGMALMKKGDIDNAIGAF